MSAPSNLVVMGWVILFLVTGWWLSVGVQIGKHNGFDDPSLVIFVYSLGNFAMIALDPSPLDVPQPKATLFAALMDAISNVIFAVSLLLAGSAYHTVIYSSLPMFVAAARYVVLKEHILRVKILAIMVMIAGLSMTVTDATRDFANRKNDDKNDADLLLGVVWSFGCVIVMSLTYVSMEWVQSLPNPPNNIKLTWATGLAGLCVSTVLLVARRHIVVTKLAAMPVRSWVGFVAVYGTLAASNGSHMVAFFWLMDWAEDGAVLLGILQGVRVVIVILAGALLLCHQQLSQCMTPMKAVSVTVVILGVSMFLFAAHVPRCLQATWRKITGKHSISMNETQSLVRASPSKEASVQLP